MNKSTPNTNASTSTSTNEKNEKNDKNDKNDTRNHSNRNYLSSIGKNVAPPKVSSPPLAIKDKPVRSASPKTFPEHQRECYLCESETCRHPGHYAAVAIERLAGICIASIERETRSSSSTTFAGVSSQENQVQARFRFRACSYHPALGNTSPLYNLYY